MKILGASRCLTLIVPRCPFVNRWCHRRPVEQWGHQGQEHCGVAQQEVDDPVMSGFWVERERSAFNDQEVIVHRCLKV